jgi:hypothetical protein
MVVIKTWTWNMERENASQRQPELMNGETEEALEHQIDVETFRLLAIFQDEIIRQDSRFNSLEFLKQYSDRIKKMGSVFELLSLARPVVGTELAWRPTKRLRQIIYSRMLLRKPQHKFYDTDEFCVARLMAYCEIASECQNIVCAFGLNDELKGHREFIRKVRELIISTSEGRLVAKGIKPVFAEK